MSSTRTLTDHREIRKWVEERSGRPARVKGTGDGKAEDAGILRLDFAEPDDRLEQIDWEDFFETFEDRELALLVQDETADGGRSRFNKFVARGG